MRSRSCGTALRRAASSSAIARAVGRALDRGHAGPEERVPRRVQPVLEQLQGGPHRRSEERPGADDAAFSRQAHVDEEQGQPPERQPAPALERGTGRRSRSRCRARATRRLRPGPERLLEVVLSSGRGAAASARAKTARPRSTRQEDHGQEQGEHVVAAARGVEEGDVARRCRSSPRARAERPLLELATGRAPKYASGRCGARSTALAKQLLGARRARLVELRYAVRHEGQRHRLQAADVALDAQAADLPQGAPGAVGVARRLGLDVGVTRARRRCGRAGGTAGRTGPRTSVGFSVCSCAASGAGSDKPASASRHHGARLKRRPPGPAT